MLVFRRTAAVRVQHKRRAVVLGSYRRLLRLADAIEVQQRLPFDKPVAACRATSADVRAVREARCPGDSPTVADVLADYIRWRTRAKYRRHKYLQDLRTANKHAKHARLECKAVEGACRGETTHLVRLVELAFGRTGKLMHVIERLVSRVSGRSDARQPGNTGQVQTKFSIQSGRRVRGSVGGVDWVDDSPRKGRKHFRRPPPTVGRWSAGGNVPLTPALMLLLDDICSEVAKDLERQGQRHFYAPMSWRERMLTKARKSERRSVPVGIFERINELSEIPNPNGGKPRRRPLPRKLRRCFRDLGRFQPLERPTISYKEDGLPSDEGLEPASVVAAAVGDDVQ